MRSRIVLILSAVATVGLVVGCGESSNTDDGRSIVAAFYPLAYAAERIAPDATVSNLTPAGAEPHDLELTPRDIERVRGAGLVLYLRGFMPALDDAVSGESNALDGLGGLELLRGVDGHGHEDEPDHDVGPQLDPHVWLDPMRYAAMATRIAEELGTPDAAADLVADLGRLDADLREGLARCERRVIVTSHAAFAYLADAYDLEQVALTGLAPEAEPSARALEGLVREVEERGATTVFFETLASPRLAETVAREAGATTAVLDPLEGLTDDEAESGADYFTVMRENLSTLRTALGCS